MKINKTLFKELFHFELDPKLDDRGSFTRLFCKKTLNSLGMKFSPKQISFATNKNKFTLRGIHFQRHPNQEQKIVSCLKGSIWDVVVDIRENSKNYGRWFAIELSEKRQNFLYIPKGFAHGYLTLTTNTHIIYLMDEYYNEKNNLGIFWQDPNLNIKWPHLPLKISIKDQNLPRLNDL